MSFINWKKIKTKKPLKLKNLKKTLKIQFWQLSLRELKEEFLKKKK